MDISSKNTQSASTSLDLRQAIWGPDFGSQNGCANVPAGFAF
jgi:hypothetical protein